MAQFLLLCLILAHFFIVLTKANESDDNMVVPNMAHSSNPPFPSPLEKPGRAKAPAARKLGKHRHKMVKNFVAPSLSPSEAPQIEESMQSMKEASSSDEYIGQEIHVKMQHQHHSIDKSVAGGGVILGGLATIFMVAVFCYIRATGRKNAEPNA